MTAPELKPCPFCGGEALLRDDVSHSTAYFIGCATEDCFGEIHWGKSEAEAVSGWNTRAAPAALAVPEVAALVEALRVARAHVANNAEGWSVSRGASRDDLIIVDAALRGVGARS